MKIKKYICAVSLIVATFSVYWPSLGNGFVWDDTALILRDPFIRSWRLIPTGFRYFLFTDATASNFYRPVQRLTYTFDYAWHGFQPWGFHLTNIILHAAAAVAFFLFAQKLISNFNPASASKSWLPALLAAFIWAIHPLHTSAVIYISGRADLLAALFGFAGLYLGLVSFKKNKKLILEISASLCFLLAMLSKESGIAVILIWFVILFFHRDLGLLKRWLSIAIIVFGIYCGLRFSAEKIEPPPTEFTPLTTRPILAARAMAEYAGLLVAPYNLHLERDVSGIKEVLRNPKFRGYQTLIGILLMGTFVVWCCWARRSIPIVYLLLWAFLISYWPISNFFSLNATVAEHWLYFPAAFLIVAVVLCVSTRLNYFGRIFKLTTGILFLFWVMFLITRTFVRNFDWKDQRTFLENTISNGGDSARMFINLGILELSEGRPQLAIENFKKAIQRSSNQPLAFLGLAAAYIRLHDFTQARAQLEKTLSIPHMRAESLQYLAVIEYQENHNDPVNILHEATKLAPKNWSIQKRYILHLDERGETIKAIHELRLFLQKQPFRSESWGLLGDLLLKISQPDLAKRAFERAAACDIHKF